MTHPFLETVAQALERRGIATLRFQFPYMESRSKRPDPPKLAQATIRAAVAEAARLAPGVPLIAGGRSFGGRMASQAQAASPLPNVRGLAFLGFPLISPTSHQRRGASIFSISRSRCCSFRERAMLLLSEKSSSRWSAASAIKPH
jgi:predicted alpha/beta-hydrolase family hydrolase